MKRVLLWTSLATFAPFGLGQTLPVATAVGSTRVIYTVTVTMAQSGTAATPAVVTGGVANLDFTFSANNSAGYCTQRTYAQGEQCKVDVLFAPRFPGLRWGAVVLRDITSTQVIGTAQMNGLATGALPALYPGLTSTVAGHEDFLYESPSVSDGIPAIAAPIQLPKGVAIDASGNLYIADYLNYRIRKVAANSTGVLDNNSLISTVAGNGTPGFSGDGGPATQASIASPTGLAIDGAGNLYFADTNNDVIRKIDNAGVITTVAGLPRTAGYTGDGGPATAATLDHPEGVAFDLQGNLLIADTHNNRIRTVSLSSVVPTISTLTTGPLNLPSQMATQADGTLLIANTGSNQVLAFRSGSLSVLAGSGARGYSGDGGLAMAAQLNQPVGIAVDPAGDIYIADQGNNRLRVVDPVSKTISTAAGTGNEAFTGDCATDTTAPPNLCGPQTSASFNGPWGVQFSPLGELYLSDPFHNRVRRFSGNNVLARYATIRNLKVSPPQTITLRNLGNDQLSITAPICDQTKLDGTPPACAFPVSATTSLAPLDSLSVAVDYTPNVPGPFPYNGTGSLQFNIASTTPVHSSPVIDVQAQVLDVNPTSVTLIPGSNPAVVNAPLHLVATVSNNNAGTFTGTVTFTVDNAVVCSAVPLTGVTAGCDVTFTSIGHHTVIAEYSGDAQDAGSQSAPLDELIKLSLDPASGLSAAPSPQTVTQQVTLTFRAVAPAGGATPTGTVLFNEGSNVLGSASITGGVATIAISNLTVGSHPLSASYIGDGTYMPYQAGTTEVIQKASTSTLLSSNSDTVLSGATVTLTATVSPTITTTLSGAVTFMDGPTVLASGVALNSSNQAIFSTASLSSGVHSIHATYGGDTDNNTSTSATLTETINLIGTSTTLTPSANPLKAGGMLHLTVQVAVGAGLSPNGPVTGSVIFTDGTSALATVPLDNNASASLDLNALTVGTHVLVATYNGNPSYAQSRDTISETVQHTDTNAVGASHTPVALAGTEVSLSATVISSTGVPTGTVSFQDGPTVVGTALLDAQGHASYITTSLPAGTHSLTVAYQGDANYNPSTSAPFSQQIDKANPQLTLNGPTNPVNVTTLTTFTAALSTPGVAPTGMLTLYDGATVIATQQVSSTGTFTLGSSSLTVGQHSISIAYSGDINTAPVTSAAVNVTVQFAPSTTTLVSSANPAILGASISFTAAVTSVTGNLTGSVQFLDGTKVLGSVPLNNGSATLTTSELPFGMHAVSAVYVGDANHASATSDPVRQSIIYKAVLAATAAPNPAYTGQDVVLTAGVGSINGLVPTGTISFQDAGVVLGRAVLDASGTASIHVSTLSVGSHAIAVAYSGDTNYSTAEAATNLVVQNSVTQTVVRVDRNPATFGANLTLSATVTSTGGTATGTLRFTEAGTVIGTATLDSTGNASIHTASLAPGPHSVTAQYAGDGRASASTSSPAVFLVKQRTALALSADNNPALSLDGITLRATLGYDHTFPATGSVSFAEGAKSLGTALLDANGVAALTVSALPVGTHTITATYGGDDSDYGADAAPLAEVVSIRSTTTKLSSFASNSADPQQITYVAIVQSPTLSKVAGPTGTVSFYRGSSLVTTARVDANGVVNVTLELQVNTPATLTAVYSGDASYATSTSDPSTASPGPATNFVLSVSKTDMKLQTGQRQTVTVTVASIKGFTDDMRFGCVGLPYAATCTFTKSGIKLAADGSGSMDLVIDTADPLGAGATAANTKPKPFATSTAVLCCLPLGALLLCGVRRKFGLKLLLVLIAASVSFVAVGCGGLQINSTPAGNYTFQVTAIGQGTGAQQAVTVKLAVGK
ncbi:Ig-like domain repeat protein [Terriglobus sp.]|uniref:Ig-like domain repeat protein n=1 Tax=Terriglobus sp. TaxID=1889013 RepID=UPI003AFFAF31